MDVSLIDAIRSRISAYLADGGTYTALSAASRVPFSTIRMLHQRPDRDAMYGTLVRLDKALLEIQK